MRRAKTEWTPRPTTATSSAVGKRNWLHSSSAWRRCCAAAFAPAAASGRGKRLGHIGTSDIYASVTRRALEIEQSEGLASLPQRGAPTGTGPTVRSESAPSSEPAPRGLWTLLLLLVDRVIVDAKRRERAQQRAAEQSSQARAAREHGGPGHMGPEQAALSADEQAMLRTLVGQLSDQDRELVALRLSGRTWPDIATTLGWTPANCRQRWHRLVGQLAEALRETHGETHE